MKSKKRPAQTQGFADMTSNAVINKLKPYIENSVQQATAQLAQTTVEDISALATRLVSLENIICEKLGMTREDLAQRVADEEDIVLGMERVEEVQQGDTVRVENVYINNETQTVIGTRRQLIHDIGADSENGPINFPTLLGAKSGTTIDINIPGNDKVTVKMTVNRVSRKKA